MGAIANALSDDDNKKIIAFLSAQKLTPVKQPIDEALANEIIIYRQRKPFKNIKDLVLVDGFNSDILYRIENMIDVKSENFLAKIDITKGERKYKMIILLNRQNKTKIVWRKLY